MGGRMMRMGFRTSSSLMTIWTRRVIQGTVPSLLPAPRATASVEVVSKFCVDAHGLIYVASGLTQRWEQVILESSRNFCSASLPSPFSH